MNCYVTLKVFKEKWPVEKAVSVFCTKIGCADSQKFIELLKLNDEVIKELLYISEVAEKKLFFRRVRVPPLLTVYWNTIFINDSARKVLRHLVNSPKESVRTGFKALKKIVIMRSLAEELGLPAEDLQFMADTYRILAHARAYYFLAESEKSKHKIRKAKKKYKKTYPQKSRPRYRIKIDYSPFPVNIRHLGILLRLSLRTKRGYRIVDYLFTIHLLGLFYRLLVKVNPKSIPAFARKHAMGIGTIFR